MSLDPQARQFLDVLASAGLPPLHTLPADQAREQSRRGRENIPPGPVVYRVEDHAAPATHGDVPVRVYWPTDERGLPVLVWFHGGGWVIGDLEGADPTCRRLATMADCVVISVDYRLAPEHPAPAAYEDAYAATVWAARAAASLEADGERVAVGGDSAGGNLAAAVALLARERGGPALAHQLLVYPVTDCGMDTPSYAENSTYLLTPELMRWFWDCYAPEPAVRDDPCISPLRAESLAGLPPAHVVTAEYDPLRDEGRAYAARLREAGVPVRDDCYEGQIHGFFGAAHFFDAGRRATEAAAEELCSAFAVRRATP